MNLKETSAAPEAKEAGAGARKTQAQGCRRQDESREARLREEGRREAGRARKTGG